jgi:uncharacterized membrane protein
MISIIPNWHPILVHFTIGLLSISVVFYFAQTLLPIEHKWKQQWLHMANWSLWTGCLFILLTVVAGWYAYNTVAHDTASHEAMTLHRNWALPTAVLFLIIGISAIGLAKKDNNPNPLFLSVSTVAAIMLMVTGWLGSEAVYRYGLGVMSLPVIEDGHDHSHDDPLRSGTVEQPSHPHTGDQDHDSGITTESESDHDNDVSHEDGHHH